MSRHLAALALLAALVLPSAPAAAAVVDAETEWPGDGACAIRLRYEDGSPLRGVVVLNTGFDGDNRAVVDDPRWRAAAALWGFGLVGTYLRGDDYGDASVGSGDALLRALGRLADTTGRAALRHAPMVMYGFSHGAAFTYSFAWSHPERVIAFVAAKTGFPTDADVPAALLVPGLLVYGEFDDDHVYPAVSALFARHRAQGARWALAEDWGMGHEYGNTEALAMPFFDRAITRRLPAGANPAAGPVALIAPPADGASWLGDVWHLDRPLATISADAATYPGDTARAGWFGDGGTAVLWRAMSSRGDGAVLASPAAFASYAVAPCAIDLAVDAGGCSGSVSAIAWYDADVRLGTSSGQSGSLWHATWRNPPRGMHALSAVVTLATGESLTTRAAPVIVTAAPTAAATFDAGSPKGDPPPPARDPELSSGAPSATGRACGLGSMSAAAVVLLLRWRRARRA